MIPLEIPPVEHGYLYAKNSKPKLRWYVCLFANLRRQIHRQKFSRGQDSASNYENNPGGEEKLTPSPTAITASVVSFYDPF